MQTTKVRYSFFFLLLEGCLVEKKEKKIKLLQLPASHQMFFYRIIKNKLKKYHVLNAYKYTVQVQYNVIQYFFI